MSKVSILIAAYNVEKYIDEALKSAVSQTLKDIEIVVVDDCSTDGTSEIIEKYAKEDERIKVVRHGENGGLVRVRQTGLKNSSGEYIIFLDGDDKLSPHACEKAYKAITKEKVDMLQFDLKPLFISPSAENKSLEIELREFMRSVERKVVFGAKAGILNEKAIGGVVNFSIWNKIYKRTLLEETAAHVPDEYINMAEDVLFSFLIQYHARSYSYISDKLYIYRYGSGMSTVAALSERQIKAYSKTAFVYGYLDEWVKKQDAEKECLSALRRVYKQTYHCIADVYIRFVPKEQKALFISEVLKCGSPDMLVLALSELQYNNFVTPEDIANECAGLDMFKAKKTKAETVGVYYYRMYNGGVENVISSLTDIWVKAGYNVVLFTDEKPSKDDYYVNPSVKRVTVPAITDGGFFNRKERIEGFSKALKENGVDVMVYNAWVNADLVLDEMIIKSCGVNLIIHTHSLFCCETASWHGPTAYFYASLPTYYAFADSVVALSDVDAAWWRMMGVRSFKTRNPVQIRTDVKTAPLNGNNMLYVGRISEEKRVIEVLKIAALVKKEIPDARLTVVGKGDDLGYVARVDDYIVKNGLKDTVDMVGFKSDVIPYYAAADVMISTSRTEGSPLSWIESKLVGVPLVSYELAHLDFSRDRKGLVVVDQMDANAAANAIVKIFRDDALKKELGRQARESAEEYLSIDLTEIWKNIFTETLMSKPETLSLSELPVAEAAVRIAVNNYNTGIFNRTVSSQSKSSPRYAELEDELNRFKRSESYRIGCIITYIPRKIKAFLRKLFKRR